MRKEIVNRRNIALSALFFLNAVLLVMLIKMFHLNAVATVVKVFSLALGMVSFVFISMQALNRTPTKVCKFTAFMGRHSLEIYLVHEFVFATFMLLFNRHCHFFLMMVIAFSASVVIACVCNIAAERVKCWIYGD